MGEKEGEKKKEEIFAPPLKTRPFPAQVAYLPPRLPRNRENSLPLYTLTSRKNTIPYTLFPPTLLRLLIKKLQIPLLNHVASSLTYPLLLLPYPSLQQAPPSRS